MFVVLLVMAPSYLEVGAPGKPGAVHKPDFIAFEVVLKDGTVVAYDHGNDDGCTFEVTLPGNVTTDVEYHDGNPVACGASIDYVDELADEPFEVVLQVVEMARERV